MNPIASNYRLLLGALFVALIGFFSCTEHDNPIGLSSPAGKATVDQDAGEPLIISWSCDTAVDSVWTIFYGSAYRFEVHGEDVLFTHYVAPQRKKRYWATEQGAKNRVRAIFRARADACGLYSEVLDDPLTAVRIYKGVVRWQYRDTSHSRYVLEQDDQSYPIAFVGADGAVRHRDFYAFHNSHDPRPAGLTEIRSASRISAYYLPVNFMADEIVKMPIDDRSHLINPLSALTEQLLVPESEVVTPEPESEAPVSTPNEPAPSEPQTTITTTVVTLITQVIEEEEEEEEEETVDPSCVPDPVYVSITGGDNINSGTKTLRWTYVKMDAGKQLLRCESQTRIRNCRTRIGFSVSGVSSYQAEWVTIDNNGRCGPINPFEKVKVTFTNSCGDQQTAWSHCTKRSAGNSLWCDQGDVFYSPVRDRGPCDSLGEIKRI